MVECDDEDDEEVVECLDVGHHQIADVNHHFAVVVDVVDTVEFADVGHHHVADVNHPSAIGEAEATPVCGLVAHPLDISPATASRMTTPVVNLLILNLAFLP